MPVFSQGNKKNWIQNHSTQRLYTALYASYFNNNIVLVQAGYDYAVRLISFTPEYNLLDLGLGINALSGFNQVNEEQTDNFGHIRPDYAQITPGFELNWNARMYAPPFPVVQARIFIEGIGMSLVIYARPYPQGGTNINIGSHAGIGIEYPVKAGYAYTAIRLFHSSNGQVYENNPALNAAGIVFGIQF